MRNILDLLQKFMVFFKNGKPGTTRGLSKSKGQSLVEIAISLPILILLFSGMVEFGFMLNTYLTLQDGVRAAARRFSLENPFMNDVNGNTVDRTAFYQGPDGAAQAVVDALMPPEEGARQVPVDENRDNVLISVITISVDESTDPDTITSLTRFPKDTQYYKLYNATNPGTLYIDDKIKEYVTSNGAVPVDAGLLIIEVYYSYEGVLHLPWTEPFFSEENPAMLYNSTIMPLVSAKP